MGSILKIKFGGGVGGNSFCPIQETATSELVKNMFLTM